MMWGIVPAAGKGTRIQPLAFSKELLPLSSSGEGAGKQPRAVSDFLMERFAASGVDRVCFVISAGKSDILEYYGGSAWASSICYTVQPFATGLCDAIFRALPFISDADTVAIGLPDTVWFPVNGLALLPPAEFSLLLFPVSEPRHFDSVEFNADGLVSRVKVKDPAATSKWIWGAMRLPGFVLHSLFALWNRRGRTDEFLGTLINAWIDEGGKVRACPVGESYHDVGTMDGYLATLRLISGESIMPSAGAA